MLLLQLTSLKTRSRDETSQFYYNSLKTAQADMSISETK